MTKPVAVLYGGWSSEREVSLVSGRNGAEAREGSSYEVTLIDVEHDLTALIAALDPAPDVVFNALHGRHGEDGKIQGLLDILEIPYTHSGMLASALAMDKPMAKRLFATVAIPCPDGRVVRREELANGPVIDPPYVIKPPNEGPSVGLRIGLEGDNRPPPDDWPFGDAVLVEKRAVSLASPRQGAGVGERRLLPPLAAAELEHDDGFQPRRPLDRGAETAAVPDAFEDAGDDAGAVVIGEVVDVIGGIDHRFVAARDQVVEAGVAVVAELGRGVE